jgi:hypothetical protein
VSGSENSCTAPRKKAEGSRRTAWRKTQWQDPGRIKQVRRDIIYSRECGDPSLTPPASASRSAAQPALTPASPVSPEPLQTPQQDAAFPGRASQRRPHLLPAGAPGRRHPRRAPRPRRRGNTMREGTSPPTTIPPPRGIDTRMSPRKGRLLPPPPAEGA